MSQSIPVSSVQLVLVRHTTDHDLPYEVRFGPPGSDFSDQSETCWRVFGSKPHELLKSAVRQATEADILREQRR